MRYRIRNRQNHYCGLEKFASFPNFTKVHCLCANQPIFFIKGAERWTPIRRNEVPNSQPPIIFVVDWKNNSPAIQIFNKVHCLYANQPIFFIKGVSAELPGGMRYRIRNRPSSMLWIGTIREPSKFLPKSIVCTPIFFCFLIEGAECWTPRRPEWGTEFATVHYFYWIHWRNSPAFQIFTKVHCLYAHFLHKGQAECWKGAKNVAAGGSGRRLYCQQMRTPDCLKPRALFLTVFHLFLFPRLSVEGGSIQGNLGLSKF